MMRKLLSRVFSSLASDLPRQTHPLNRIHIIQTVRVAFWLTAIVVMISFFSWLLTRESHAPLSDYPRDRALTLWFLLWTFFVLWAGLELFVAYRIAIRLNRVVDDLIQKKVLVRYVFIGLGLLLVVVWVLSDIFWPAPPQWIWGILPFLFYGWLLAVYTKVADPQSSKKEQKERVRILTGFEPKPEILGLAGHRSIYDYFIRVIQDVERCVGERHRICLLLCSPCVDYLGNPRSLDKDWAKSRLPNDQVWGREFFHKIEKMVAGEEYSDVRLDIAFLSEAYSGYRPLDDFNEVLAAYIAGNNNAGAHDRFAECLGHIKEVTQDTLTKLRNRSQESLTRIRLSEHLGDIPFQICLAIGDKVNEVVIAFAGKEILERGAATDPQGFFSSDPYVVETFHRVFEDYAAPAKRRSVLPLHTLNIVARSREQAASHGYELRNYFDLGIHLRVSPNVFSPLVANSSKFTSWAIQKTVRRGDRRILDLGAGTGVLGITAVKALQQLGAPKENIKLVAVEVSEVALSDLHVNIERNGLQDYSTIISGELTFELNGQPASLPSSASANQMREALKSARSRAYIRGRSAADEKAIEDELRSFDLIIADLPFVDAVCDASSELRAYLDHAHLEQYSFLKWVRDTPQLLSPEGRVITSFSTLGGATDVARFERMFLELKLTPLQKLTFFEDGYGWITYILRRSEMPDGYWRDLLSVPAATPLTADIARQA